MFFNEVKAKMIATTKNGTNIQKIQFQDNLAKIKPVTVGPIAAKQCLTMLQITSLQRLQSLAQPLPSKDEQQKSAALIQDVFVIVLLPKKFLLYLISKKASLIILTEKIFSRK